jgi:D,D-heptose 1,7-bisphosphate phosphatase
MNRAIFLDRDGVINEMVYHSDHGIIDSPFTPAQFKLVPGVGRAIEKFRALGYLVVLVSNQPGIAKGHYTQRTFQSLQRKMTKELSLEGARLDGEYYCLHHPDAKDPELSINCGCRKPKPGLLLNAAREMNINLAASWMIGDGLTDVQAGKNAGAKTLLLATLKCDLCQKMDEKNARPDAILPALGEVAVYLNQLIS